MMIFSSGAFATTFLQMSFDQYLDSADLICGFEVLSSQSEAVRGSIRTRIQLKVLEDSAKRPLACAKGKTPQEISVIAPGGQLQIRENGRPVTRIAKVPGSPTHLKKGDQILAYLLQDQGADYSFLQMQLGIRELRFNSSTRQYDFKNQKAIAREVRSSPQSRSLSTSTTAPRNLSEFNEIVRSLRGSRSKSSSTPHSP